MDAKAIDLFKAYSEGTLPTEGGFIVSCFFQENSSYAKYEIAAYRQAQSLYLTADGLAFMSGGNKLFVVAEPADYDKKDWEPFTRAGQQQIPHRFSEVEQYTASNLTRILISRQPVIVYSSFTIPRPTKLNFSLLFYNRPGLLESIVAFFKKSLAAQSGISAGDAAAAARRIAAGLQRLPLWKELQGRPAAPSGKPKTPPKAGPKTASKAKTAAKRKPKPRAAARKPTRRT